MSVDPNKVALAMARGLSAVCATCTRYWEARDRGISGDGCTTRIRCGSPIAGDTFSDYDGPLKGALNSWCFVCAQKSDFGIRVPNRVQVVGACVKHIGLLQQLQAVNGPQTSVEVRSSQGPLETPSTSRRKTLGEAIQEVENYYAKKEGREPEV